MTNSDGCVWCRRVPRQGSYCPAGSCRNEFGAAAAPLNAVSGGNAEAANERSPHLLLPLLPPGQSRPLPLDPSITVPRPSTSIPPTTVEVPPSVTMSLEEPC